MEETQRLALANQRLALRLQSFALALLGLSLLGTGWLIWLTWGAMVASDAHTQALLELLRRMSR